MRVKKDNQNKQKVQLPIKSNKSKSTNVLWFIFILISLCLVIYYKTFHYAFVAFDDNAKVYENPLITTLSLSQIRLFFTSFVFHTYTPLSLLSYAIDYSLWQLSPGGYHTVNVVLHVVNVLFVFIFIRRFSGNQITAFIAAMLFAIHPLNVETVAWISERSNLLYALFFILSLYFYSVYTETKKKSILLLTFICFLLSLLSKPGAVLIPVVFVLMDIYKKNSFNTKKYLQLSLFFVFALATGIVALYASKVTGNIRDISSSFNWLDRLSIASYSLSVYLIKFFLPFNLSALYPFPEKSGTFLPMIYSFSLLVPILLLFFVLKTKQLKNVLAFGLLFFVVNISIVLMLVPVGGNFMIAEHFVYVPYIGLCFIAGTWISGIISNKYLLNPKYKPFIIPALIAVILTFSIVSNIRTNVWKNGKFLFSDMIKKCPEQAMGYYGLGIVNYMEGDLKSALAHQTAAIMADSTYSDAWYNRGIIYKEQKLFDLALVDLNQAIKLTENKNYKAFCDRGNIYLNSGDTLKAMEDYNTSIKIYNKYASSFYNRGRLKNDLKDYEGAILDFDQAISIDKFDANALNNRATAKFFLNDLQESITDYDQAIKIDSKNGLYFRNRGLSYLALKDSIKACDDFYQAYSLGFKGAGAQLKKYCN